MRAARQRYCGGRAHPERRKGQGRDAKITGRSRSAHRGGGISSHPPSRKLEVRVLLSIAALQIVVIVTKMDVDYEQHVLD